MLGPQLLETKPTGEGFRQGMVELDLASGALRAAPANSAMPGVDDGSSARRPAKRLLVNCAYGATFQEPPAKYAAMHVIGLQEPGQRVHFLRFENAEDKARWQAALAGTMVEWPPLPPLSFEFMSGPGGGVEPEPEPEPEPKAAGARGGSARVELVEPVESESPIADEDFAAARAVIGRFEQLDSLSAVPGHTGHPSGFRLLSKTPHLELFKSKERATKHFLYRPSALSCRGIPARFIQDVMRDDEFVASSNPRCTEFTVLDRRLDSDNETVYQLVELSSFKSKPRELLTLRARRREAASQTEATMLRSTFHPDKPVQHREGVHVNNPSCQPQHAVRSYQFLYSLVRPAAAAAAAASAGRSRGESCEVIGLMRLQPRGDCPRSAIDTVATTVMEEIWARLREEAVSRMEKEGLPLPPTIVDSAANFV